MANMLAYSEAPLELELASTEQPWVDRLLRGMWPKPLVFWAVVFYIGLFIIRPWEKLIPELGEMRFERMSVLAIMAIVLLRRGIMVRFSTQNIAMLLLFASVYVSGKLAFDPSLSEQEVTEYFGFMLIFFLIQKAVRSPYQAFFIIASYLMLTTLYVGKSIWEYAFHGAAQHMMGVSRLGGIDYTYGHPNTLGTTMLCSLPFALCFYKISSQFCQTWPRQMRKLFRWVVILHVPMCILGVLLTRSRSTAVGLVFYAAILVFRQKGWVRKLRWSLVAIVVFLIGFMLAPPDIQNRIRTLWKPNIESQTGQMGAQKAAAGRYEGLIAGVAIFQRFPATGVGIGNFADYRETYVDGEALNAHNLPGELLGELGIFGTAAFSLYFLAHYLALRKLQRLGKEYQRLTGNDMYYWLGVGLFDAMLLLMFSGLSGHTLQQYQWYFYPSFAITALYFLKQAVSSARAKASSITLVQDGI